MRTVDFEGVAAPGGLATLPSPYEDFDWKRVSAADVGIGIPGVAAVLQSGSAAGFIGGDGISKAKSQNGDFDLSDIHFAAAFSSGITLKIRAFDDGVLVAKKHVVLDVADLLLMFNHTFDSIDMVKFHTVGGSSVMDDMHVTFEAPALHAADWQV